jgi:hypothetical protein
MNNIKQKFLSQWWEIKKIKLEWYSYLNYFINWNNYRIPDTTDWYDNLDISNKFISEKDLYKSDSFLREIKTIKEYKHKYNIWDIIYYKLGWEMKIKKITWINFYSYETNYEFWNRESISEENIIWIYK